LPHQNENHRLPGAFVDAVSQRPYTFFMAIYAMTNRVQNYEWGSPTAIPYLLGEETEDDAPGGATPVAELWMGAHPKSPSLVQAGGGEVSLLELIRAEPERVLGRQVHARYGAELPFLFKILAAERALSIQSHPSKEEAEAGFARENAAGIPLDAHERNYRDANHKPELICAVTEFWGMRGFRPVEEIAADLLAVDSATSRSLAALLDAGSEASSLRNLVSTLLALSAAERRELVNDAMRYAEREWARRRAEGYPEPAVAAAALPEVPVGEPGAPHELVSDPARAPERYFWLLEIARDYPEDIGVLGPLYLNTVRLRPEEAMYLPAGVLHAYLRGTGIELMANSDNVLRGGCTSKHIDVAELLKTTNFLHEQPEILKAEGNPPRWYHSGAREFRLSVCDLDADRVDTRAPLEIESAGPLILLQLSGESTIEESAGRTPAGSPFRLARGRSAFVTGDAGPLRLSGTGRIYIAGVMEAGA